MKLSNKLPFQIFPGIFNSIDLYTKDVIHSFFDMNGKFPIWLEELGEIVNYQKPPHYSKFNILDEENNILLTGTPDAIFQKKDGSYLIADYKTAKYTETQDALLPIYEVQLNGYAVIGNKRGLNPVTDLALIYFEPVTQHEAACDSTNCSDNGFLMHFHAYIKKVELNPTKITKLLSATRELFDLEGPPNGREGCNDCGLLDRMLGLL
ncbi:MAG: PD-(D/E)XK nuclease family protein [Chloroflexota bacterium]